MLADDIDVGVGFARDFLIHLASVFVLGRYDVFCGRITRSHFQVPVLFSPTMPLAFNSLICGRRSCMRDFDILGPTRAA